jgi:dTMP kinase
MAGKFIVFEGLDGSGQSTQARLLAEKLRAEGRTVVLGKEPTEDSAAGREVTEVLTHKKSMPPEDLQKLFVEDRKAHLQNSILPALAAGAIVLEDRYSMSTFAFGSVDCDLEWLIELNQGLPWPDATFILKVRPEVSLARIAARGKPAEFFEKKEKLEKVAAAYDALAERFPNCFVLDGELPIEAVHAQVLQHLPGVLE